MAETMACDEVANLGEVGGHGRFTNKPERINGQTTEGVERAKQIFAEGLREQQGLEDLVEQWMNPDYDDGKGALHDTGTSSLPVLPASTHDVLSVPLPVLHGSFPSAHRWRFVVRSIVRG